MIKKKEFYDFGKTLSEFNFEKYFIDKNIKVREVTAFHNSVGFYKEICKTYRMVYFKPASIVICLEDNKNVLSKIELVFKDCYEEYDIILLDNMKMKFDFYKDLEKEILCSLTYFK